MFYSNTPKKFSRLSCEEVLLNNDSEIVEKREVEFDRFNYLMTESEGVKELYPSEWDDAEKDFAPTRNPPCKKRVEYNEKPYNPFEDEEEYDPFQGDSEFYEKNDDEEDDDSILEEGSADYSSESDDEMETEDDSCINVAREFCKYRPERPLWISKEETEVHNDEELSDHSPIIASNESFKYTVYDVEEFVRSIRMSSEAILQTPPREINNNNSDETHLSTKEELNEHWIKAVKHAMIDDR